MKGLVIETKGKNAILLQDNGQFITIKNRHYLVGEEVIMNKNSLQKRGLAMAAAAAVFIMLITTGVFAYVTPYYHVSLDVNPGLTMEVNRFERVIGIEYLNEDAKAIIEDLDWKNNDIELVISDAVKLLEQKGYFDEAGEILIAAAGKNDEKALFLADKLAETTGELGISNAEVSSQAIGYDMVQAAKEFGMTPGRYNIITRLLGEDVDTENVEEYKNRSVRDLMSQFTESKGVMGKEIASAARERSQGTEKDEGEQAANQRAADVRQDNNQKAADVRQDDNQEAADVRQDDEQTVPQAQQAEAETRQDAEQAADEVIQTVTEAEETVNEAIQNATEAVQEAGQTVDEATQPATEALQTTQETQPETTENNQVETDDVVPETTTRR